MFFPRGGSAQVARYLSRELAALGGRFRPRLVAGSVGPARGAGRRARVLRRPRPRGGRLRRGPARPRSPRRLAAAAPLVRGPARRARPRDGGAGRRRVRAPRRRVGGDPGRARRPRRRGGRPPAPPHAGPRGARPPAAGPARDHAPPRHRAAHARGDRRRAPAGPTRRTGPSACAGGPPGRRGCWSRRGPRGPRRSRRSTSLASWSRSSPTASTCACSTDAGRAPPSGRRSGRGSTPASTPRR